MTRRYSRGFTLVEILVSLVILAGVAIVLADTIGAGAVAHTRLDDTTRAWRVASDKLVELQVYQRWPGIGVQDLAAAVPVPPESNREAPARLHAA